ncbi:MAG: flagellar hook capping FlgD N-terminal domain-containing protein [Thermodesulfovibrionales bacterium]|jgi:flagellar hook assembly protein FlgD|nr:flagellar hook capping FlgD N-terminal domain-containing protein [Thermodesulfovibrionales bacterium]
MPYTTPIFSDTKYTGVADSQSSVTKNTELDKNAFLNLLIAQLKNQDPLNPMKDQEFIAQLATFSSLEQMGNMNKNMEKSFSMGLLGATIIDTKGSEGVVKSIDIDMKGDTVFTLGLIDNDGKLSTATKDIKFSDIREISIGSSR